MANEVVAQQHLLTAAEVIYGRTTAVHTFVDVIIDGGGDPKSVGSTWRLYAIVGTQAILVDSGRLGISDQPQIVRSQIRSGTLLELRGMTTGQPTTALVTGMMVGYNDITESPLPVTLAGNVVGPSDDNVVEKIDGVGGAVGPNEGNNWSWAARPATASPGTFISFNAGLATATGAAGLTATGWEIVCADGSLEAGPDMGGGRFYLHIGKGSKQGYGPTGFNSGRFYILLGNDASVPILRTFSFKFDATAPFDMGWYVSELSAWVFGDTADPDFGNASVFIPPNQLLAQANSAAGPGNNQIGVIGTFSDEGNTIREVWIGEDPGAAIAPGQCTAAYLKPNIRTSNRYTFGDTAIQAATNPSMMYGDGDPNGIVTAGKASIFMRRDGAVGSRMYVNQDGATAWTAVAGV